VLGDILPEFIDLFYMSDMTDFDLSPNKLGCKSLVFFLSFFCSTYITPAAMLSIFAGTGSLSRVNLFIAAYF
jgi:hypothetical protein